MATTKVPAEFLADNTISGTIIADNAITAVHIATNAVSGILIADNAVTTVHIAENNVTGTSIVQNAVTATQIATNAINTLQIADVQVTSAKIANNAILTQHIDDNQVDSDQLADNCVTAAQIADGSITATQLGANSVTLAKMASLTRGSVLIGNSSADVTALAIGSNDYVLTSDGTDLAWEAAGGGAVSAINNATANELVTIGSTTTELDAETNLTYDGSAFKVVGAGAGVGVVRAHGDIAQSGSSMDNSTFAGVIVNNANDANGDLAGIAMYPTSAYGAAAAVFGTRESSSAAALTFWTGSNTGTEKVRITSAGLVGIGTTSPAGSLDVKMPSGTTPVLRLGRPGTCDWDFKILATSHITGGSTGDLEIIPQNGNMGFAVGRAGQTGINMRVRDGTMTVGVGIKFNGDTAAANELDDYEEGTWTPVMRANSGGTPTLVQQSGFYTKIGNIVTVSGSITWSAGGSSANTFTLITGLPYASANVSNSRSAGILGAVNGFVNSEGVRLVFDPNLSVVYVVTGTGTAYSHNNSISAAGAIYGFQMTYTAA